LLCRQVSRFGLMGPITWRNSGTAEVSSRPHMQKQASILVFVLAFAVRLIAVHIWHNNISHVDPSEYVALAQNIRLHHVFSFGSPHPWGG
jgi:hypothetical protein